jgi:myo-inositol-1(or 4)-monophosphatase
VLTQIAEVKDRQMSEIEFIEKTLIELSPMVREKYAARDQVKVTSKSNPNDLLTEVDVAVQRHIIQRINDAFPGDAIAAEEEGYGHAPLDAGARCWVIDPIDGTQNFVRGIFPCFGISVAFAAGGVPVSGGVMLPVDNDLFLAEKGAGATRNGNRIQVSSVKHVEVSRIEIDFSGPTERRETIRRATRIILDGGQIRCNCATVVALCSVACGEMEAFFHVALNPWDYAAGQVLVEEAGGKTSRLDGAPLHLFDGQRGVLATNGHIHKELMGLID